MTNVPEIGDIVVAEGREGKVFAVSNEAHGVYVRLGRADAPWSLYALPAPPPASSAQKPKRKPPFPEPPTLKETVP